MKKIGLSILTIISLTFFVGCDINKPLEFTDDLSFVAFDDATASLFEAKKDKDNNLKTQVLEIPVTIATPNEGSAVTVEFEFVTDKAIKVPALEGTDFKLLNKSKVLTFEKGFGTEYIKIETINDDVFRKDKTVLIKLKSNSANLPWGSNNVLALNISDDDHPYGWMLGEYKGSGVELRDGSLSWNLSLGGVPGDITAIKILGIANAGPYPMPATEECAVIGKFDPDKNELAIEVGVELPDFNFGPVKLIGKKGPTGEEDLKDGDKIKCSVVRNGDNVTINVPDEYYILITKGGNKGLATGGFVSDGTTVPTKWEKK